MVLDLCTAFSGFFPVMFPHIYPFTSMYFCRVVWEDPQNGAIISLPQGCLMYIHVGGPWALQTCALALVLRHQHVPNPVYGRSLSISWSFVGELFWICGKTIGPIINNLSGWLEYRLRLGLDWTCCSQGDPPNKTIDTPSRGEVKQHRTRKAGVFFALYFGTLILLICNCCNCLTITWQRSIPH